MEIKAESLAIGNHVRACVPGMHSCAAVMASIPPGPHVGRRAVSAENERISLDDLALNRASLIFLSVPGADCKSVLGETTLLQMKTPGLCTRSSLCTLQTAVCCHPHHKYSCYMIC